MVRCSRLRGIGGLGTVGKTLLKGRRTFNRFIFTAYNLPKHPTHFTNSCTFSIFHIRSFKDSFILYPFGYVWRVLFEESLHTFDAISTFIKIECLVEFS